MSGSFDRPPGRPPYPAHAPLPGFDPYDDVVTGPPSQPPVTPPRPQLSPPAPSPPGEIPVAHRGPAPPTMHAPAPQLGNTAAPRRDLYAPAREVRKETESGKAPIVPAGSVTGRSLTLVISIMCFLACLTAGAVYMMHQAADAWLHDISSEVTVQVEPRADADIERLVADVSGYLTRQPGMKSVRALSADDSAGLLEPWLGSSDVLKTLPVPRLIALEMDLAAPPNMDALRVALSTQFKGVTLDDHRQWQQQIRTVTRSFALGGLGILLLVGAATTAIIISATRSAMASNRDVVEVLHFVGATDRFIAREFEKHFLSLGIRAGLVGAISAMTVFFAMPSVMSLLGGASVTMAEMHRLIGTGALDPSGYVLLGILVVVVAALCMLTSRFGVYRMLNNKH